MSASLTSLSYAPAGAAIPGSVRARFIARRSACLPFGLLLESEVNLALWQQDALKGVPLARGPFQFQSIIGCPSDGSGDLTLSVVATIAAMTASLDERSSLFSWSIISIMTAGSQISRGRKPS